MLEPAFLRRIPPRLNVSVERETFPRMLAEPGLLYGYQSDAYWLDIGTPQKYLEALNGIATGAQKLVFLPYEASGIMASLGGIKELLQTK